MILRGRQKFSWPPFPFPNFNYFGEDPTFGHLPIRYDIFFIGHPYPGIKMSFHQKLGKVCDALKTITSVYSIMGSWNLVKTRKSKETRKILIPATRFLCAFSIHLSWDVKWNGPWTSTKMSRISGNKLCLFIHVYVYNIVKVLPIVLHLNIRLKMPHKNPSYLRIFELDCYTRCELSQSN